jgi:hypothetical protein
MKCARLPGRLIRLAAGLSVGISALLLIGCQNDEIRSYTVPKQEVRMLAAIVPHGERTWYFKLSGPVQEVGEHKAEFRRFVESSQFSDSSDQPLTWTSIPEGWVREHESKLRYATFRLGASGHPLELTVIPLGKESGSLLDNVNRWRKQLGLAPAAEADLPKLVEETKVGDGIAKLVDFTGNPSAGGERTPPFAKGREIGGGMARPAGSNPFKFKKPEGWKEAPLAMMSVATFRVVDGERSAEITISPLAGQAGGLMANVSRWRSQIGLDNASDEQINKDVRNTTVAGMPAHYVELVGPESAGAKRQGILGVVLERGSTTWFIKMRGDSQLVAKEKPNFDAFIQSMKFDPATGASDG